MFKRVVRVLVKIVLVLAVVLAVLFLFVYNNGIQYTLALLTGSLRDPYFDSAPYTPEANCFGAESCSSGDIKVLTYNVLCRICDEEQPWEERVPHLRGLVTRYDPDLIGSQELGGWADIEEYLPEGDVYGKVTFEFGPWTYADAALFYRTSRYEVLDSGQFWLSPKPQLPFGFGWLMLSAPRYLTWACLRDRQNGFTFLFMNSHFDNNPLNKETSAPLVYDTFSSHAQRLPIVFTGDFNTNPTTERYGKLLRGNANVQVFHNAADLAQAQEMQVYQAGVAEPVRTAPFDRFEHTIDHILMAAPARFAVKRWIVDYNSYGRPPQNASDHPAVFAEIRFDPEVVSAGDAAPSP